MNHTIKKLQISCLIENNSSSDRLLHEHALSFHIKADNKTILFDAGRTDALLDNMKTLEIVPEFDCIVLSHSHYDHIGNLKEIVKINSKTSQVYVGDGFFVPKWKLQDGKYIYRGAPFAPEDLAECDAVLHIVKDEEVLVPGAMAIGNVNNDIASKFYLRTAEVYQPDYFRDEVFLVIDTVKGLVVIIGCSHPGIFNIIDRVKKRLPGKKLHALLGGFHLKDLDWEATVEVGKRLEEEDIPYIGASHCTGTKILEAVKSNSLFHFTTGSTFVVE